MDEEGPSKILGANIGEIGETYILVLGNCELRLLSSSELLRGQGTHRRHVCKALHALWCRSLRW